MCFFLQRKQFGLSDRASHQHDYATYFPQLFRNWHEGDLHSGFDDSRTEECWGFGGIKRLAFLLKLRWDESVPRAHVARLLRRQCPMSYRWTINHSGLGEKMPNCHSKALPSWWFNVQGGLWRRAVRCDVNLATIFPSRPVNSWFSHIIHWYRSQTTEVHGKLSELSQTESLSLPFFLAVNLHFRNLKRCDGKLVGRLKSS